MPTKIVLSRTESKVLDMLPRGADRPIQTRTLMSLTGLSTRGLYEVINRLVSKFGIPIVSNRTGTALQRGLYIATNEQERTNGLVSIINQTQDMTHRINAVKAADLQGWQQRIV